MTYADDVDIIKRCQQGDKESFRVLVERYYQKVFWIAYQMVNNQEDARDIAQESFVRVYRSLSQFNLMSNFYTWLYRIVVNLSIDFLRKQKPGTRPISLEETGEVGAETTSSEQNLEQQEIAQEVREVLQQLPLPYRSILILRDIDGLSCKEIGKILQCNSNTVRWRLFRARQIFKENWEKYQALRNNQRPL